MNRSEHGRPKDLSFPSGSILFLFKVIFRLSVKFPSRLISLPRELQLRKSLPWKQNWIIVNLRIHTNIMWVLGILCLIQIYSLICLQTKYEGIWKREPNASGSFTLLKMRKSMPPTTGVEKLATPKIHRIYVNFLGKKKWILGPF